MSNAMEPQSAGQPISVTDHRVASAKRKREQMRRRILEATTLVFSHRNDNAPVIEDVVREANISRGAFYTHFRSLDEALLAASIEANQRMISDILPVYDFLKEPWQRASVGFRVFMIRAWQDPAWARFVTRMDAWPHEAGISIHMTRDLQRGKELGQFQFDDVSVANDFLMGASAGCIQAILQGVTDPQTYCDTAVRMLMRSLGCNDELQERGVAFSSEHLAEWESGDRSTWSTTS
jgi:AcrR family transcriptional regulator